MEAAVPAGGPAAGEGPSGAMVPREPVAASAAAPPRHVPRSPTPERGASLLSQRLMIPGTPGTRSSSCAPLGIPGPVNARAGQEGAMLSEVRRQIGQLEEKLNGQISRASQHSDRLRDAAFSRVDTKMNSIEVLQPKLDRKLAELSGNYKGLSDEMQAQIRRIDQMDSRLWESRHQLEEEVRAKFSEFESTTMQIDARVRTEKTATEDTLKKYNRRLQRLETLEDSVHSLTSSNEDTRQSLEHLYGRLVDMQQQQQDLALCAYPSPSQDAQASLQQGVDMAMFEAMESRVTESFNKRMDKIQEEFMDVASRLETQEERCKILRTQMDSREESYQRLKDRVERADWEGRLKEVSAQVKEMDQYKVFFAEQHATMDRLQKKMDFHEQSMEDLQRALKDRQAPPTPLRGEPGTASEWHHALAMPGVNGAAQAVADELQSCSARCSSAEERLDELVCEVQAIRGDLELAPKVTLLVDQLKEVAPKVIDQEKVLRELHEKVGRVEVRMGLSSGRGGAAEAEAGPVAAEAGAGGGAETPRSSRAVVREVHQLLESLDLEATLKSIGSRVTKVEAATERLKVEIEGPGVDAPSVHDD